jgi:hypothetical protein
VDNRGRLTCRCDGTTGIVRPGSLFGEWTHAPKRSSSSTANASPATATRSPPSPAIARAPATPSKRRSLEHFASDAACAGRNRSHPGSGRPPCASRSTPARASVQAQLRSTTRDFPTPSVTLCSRPRSDPWRHAASSSRVVAGSGSTSPISRGAFRGRGEAASRPCLGERVLGVGALHPVAA